MTQGPDKDNQEDTARPTAPTSTRVAGEPDKRVDLDFTSCPCGRRFAGSGDLCPECRKKKDEAAQGLATQNEPLLILAGADET